MLRLQSWSSAWICHLLDPGTGNHRLSFQKLENANATEGFASYEPIMLGFWRRFYAVYGKNGRFIFQAGRKFWDLTDDDVGVDLTFLLWGLASSLTVARQDVVLHRAILFHPLRTIASVIDPTYDAIDALDDHFFLYLRATLTSRHSKNFVASMGSRAAA